VAQTNSATQEVVVTWSDEHRSALRYGWLLARSFRYSEQCLRARWNGRAAKLWKSNLADDVLNVKFDEVSESEILTKAVTSGVLNTPT